MSALFALALFGSWMRTQKNPVSNQYNESGNGAAQSEINGVALVLHGSSHRLEVCVWTETLTYNYGPDIKKTHTPALDT